jgi:predicted enzyme related to lactoylglutathione lyase
MSTGKFCWFDLMTTDVSAASGFYAELFGWGVPDHNPAYRMIVDRHGKSLGGMMAAQPGQPSAWLPYVTTDDVAGTAARVRELGGTVLVEHEAAGVGRFVIFMDPQGAVIAAIQLSNEQGAYPREKGENHLSWSDLMSTDPAAALAFYQGVFGWSSESWGDSYFLIGDEHAGGITRAHGGAPPHWLVYVNTGDTDGVVRQVVELGGRVVAPAQDMGNIGRFAVLADPTGAVFAVMQSARRE